MLDNSLETLSKIIVASSRANGGDIQSDDIQKVLKVADKWSLTQAYIAVYLESANHYFNTQQTEHNLKRLMIAMRAGYQAMKICCGQEPFVAKLTGFNWMEIANSNGVRLFMAVPKGCFQ
ncbi:hypothetical protein ACP6PM_04080 [Dapis sp. BLCC M229]